MSTNVDPLVLDFVEWVARAPRRHAEVIETWRTSCPRLTIWEDAADAGDVTRTAIVGGIFPLIIADIPNNLATVDAAYFRQSREARFGKRLEEIMAPRDQAVVGFRKSLEPLRQTLKTQPFLGGDAPNYADYIVFGGFQWARVVSPFRLLEETDSVYAWRERLLDAFDGLARNSPGYPV